MPGTATYSNATAKLRSLTSNNYKQIGDKFGVTYDPAFGFAFKRPHWDNEWSQLACEVTVLNRTQERQIYVHWSLAPSYKLYPEIVLESPKYTVVHHNLKMTCSVHVDVGIIVTLLWQNVRNKSNIVVGNTEIERLGGEQLFDKVSKELVVTNVQLEDEGWFTCTAIDGRGDEYTTRKYVPVLNTYPEMRVQLIAEDELIIQPGNDIAVIEVLVDAFPSSEFLVYEWFKNDRKLEGRRFVTTVTSNQVTLKIYNVTSRDSGPYKLVASSGNVHESIEVNLTVKSTKLITMYYAIALGLIVIAFTMILVAIYNFVLNKFFHRKGSLNFTSFTNEQQNSVHCTKLNEFSELSKSCESLLTIEDDWKIPLERLEFDTELGHGEYGIVKKAIIKNFNGTSDRVVAVKRLRNYCTDLQKRALKEEAKTLMRVGFHENVVNLVGLVVNPKLMLAVEYCPLGDLRSFLMSIRDYYVHEPFRTDRPQVVKNVHLITSYTNPMYWVEPEEIPQDLYLPTFTDLLSYSKQIADGMCFLASKKVITL